MSNAIVTLFVVALMLVAVLTWSHASFDSVDSGAQSWKQMVENSKFRDWQGFGVEETGHIGLQDHAHEVWFRNIRIKELK